MVSYAIGNRDRSQIIFLRVYVYDKGPSRFTSNALKIPVYNMNDILLKNYVAGNHGCLTYFRMITYDNLACRYHFLIR